MVAWRDFARILCGACVLSRAHAACTGRQIRNGLLLCNLLAWMAIVLAAAWLV
jgi:hypothetical protein